MLCPAHMLGYLFTIRLALTDCAHETQRGISLRWNARHYNSQAPELGVSERVSSRVHLGPLFCAGYATFYSAQVSSRRARSSMFPGGECVAESHSWNIEVGNSPLNFSALFSCQRAILPTLVKRAEHFNVAIRLTDGNERRKQLFLWTSLKRRRNCDRDVLARNLSDKSVFHSKNPHPSQRARRVLHPQCWSQSVA